MQNRDGSFGHDEAGIVGITALSLLAFLAAGHQDGRGEYGGVIHEGVNYLLSCSLPPGKDDPNLSDFGKPAGYLYRPRDSDSRMHGHGYATQVLLLVYGTVKEDDPRTREMREKIVRAVRVIENSQTITGGWGYEPNMATFHEGSVTVTVVQALRLAADAGFIVDREVQRRGLRYLHDSQKRDGSFRYSLTDDRSTAALTAAALTAMHGFAEYYSQAIRDGLAYLRDKYGRPDGVQWFFYANYYAAQAFYRAGGESWRHWNRAVVPLLVRMQSPSNGSWDDRQGNSQAPRDHGPAYATAMTCLALSVQDGYLPLFQR